MSAFNYQCSEGHEPILHVSEHCPLCATRTTPLAPIPQEPEDSELVKRIKSLEPCNLSGVLYVVRGYEQEQKK